MQIVIVSHKNNARRYLFSVPDERYLEKGELVQLMTKCGITMGKCLTNSFLVTEDLLEVLAKQFGAKLPLSPVIGHYFFLPYESSDTSDLASSEAATGTSTLYRPDGVNADTPVLFSQNQRLDGD